MRRAAAAVGDSGLIAVASTPVAVGASALLNDVWVLAAPVGIGAFVMLLILLMQRRQVGISRAWAASEKRFRGAVEAARCGVWEWDVEADQVTVSDFMAELLGLDRGGAVPAGAVMERIHPRYREAVVHALRQAEAFGTFEVSFPVPDAQGRARWIDARGQARKDRETGAAILGVALDTTEARRAKAQAQAAESRLRDGIESVSDAFVLFDRNDRLILSNQAFEDAFGFGPGVVRRGASKQDLNMIAGLAIGRTSPRRAVGPAPARSSCRTAAGCSWSSASPRTAARWSPPRTSPPSSTRRRSASAPPKACRPPSPNWRTARPSCRFWRGSTRWP
jgi:two-component system cell cycle sensor histidine kinase PleC